DEQHGGGVIAPPKPIDQIERKIALVTELRDDEEHGRLRRAEHSCVPQDCPDPIHDRALAGETAFPPVPSSGRLPGTPAVCGVAQPEPAEDPRECTNRGRPCERRPPPERAGERREQ